MTSIFTKLINREIPAYIIAENEEYIAFLDAFPVVKGHTLVVPKKEVDKLFDLDKNTYLGLLDFAYNIAHAIEKAMPCLRVGLSVVGLEVPHAHVHLIPLNSEQDINISQKKLQLSKEEMLEITKKIQSKL